jgi:hypothetical protein
VPASTSGANRKSKFVSQKENTKAGQKSQGIEHHFFYVTHGQTNVGFVEQVNDTYKAIGADERELGTFGSLKAPPMPLAQASGVPHEHPHPSKRRVRSNHFRERGTA